MLLGRQEVVKEVRRKNGIETALILETKFDIGVLDRNMVDMTLKKNEVGTVTATTTASDKVVRIGEGIVMVIMIASCFGTLIK